MKGVVFNIFEKFISENYGEEFYEDILDECSLKSDGNFVGPETYSDSDLLEIVSKTVTKAEIPLDAALKSFGIYLFHQLAKAHPAFVDNQPNLKAFLLSVDNVIHVEVHKLHPGAVTPKFEYEDKGDNTMKIRYKSKRNLPDLFEGLAAGAAEHYKEAMSLTRSAVDADNGIWDFNITFGGPQTTNA